MTTPIAVFVAALPSQLDDRPIEGGAVVIDALRFTTTASQALASGANSVHVMQDVAVARALAAQWQSLRPNSVRLCGERHCRPIPGFDFGNSPLEYTPTTVTHRDLIFSTTNGTKAVEAVVGFEMCLLGAFVNRAAIARAIIESSLSRWTFVCAGTDGEIAGEDLMAAGAMIDWLQGHAKVKLLNDLSSIAVQLWRSRIVGDDDLQQTLESFTGGSNLVEAGYRADIQFACSIDALHVVPVRQSTGASVCFQLD